MKRLYQGFGDRVEPQTNIRSLSLRRTREPILGEPPEESHGVGQRLSGFHATQFLVDERGIDDQSGEALLAENPTDLLADPFLFELQHQPNLAIHGLKRFCQRWDPFPSSCIQLADLPQGHVSEQSSPIGRAIYTLVMQENEMAISGPSHIHLDQITS